MFIIDILSSVPCQPVQYSSTLSHKRHDFRKKVVEHKMFVLIFSTTFVWNISHSKKNWAKYEQKCVFVVMYSTRYSCHILMKLLTSQRFSKENTRMSNFMKIRPVGTELFHTDRRTDMVKLIIFFSQFCKRAKECDYFNCRHVLKSLNRRWQHQSKARYRLRCSVYREFCLFAST